MATLCAKIGLFSIGLEAYWPQFEGLKPRLEGYVAFVSSKIGALGVEVVDAGMVDCFEAAQAAGGMFRTADVDLAICFVTTYSTSSTVLPVVQSLGRPVLILNLQPTAQLDYERTGTGEWLANCQACCVPEIACAFERCGIAFHTVTGLLGLPAPTPGSLADEKTVDHPAAVKAWKEIAEWVNAVRARRVLSRSRIGFLGHTYPGMLDMYSDFTQITGAFGSHIEVLEMEDLAAAGESASEAEFQAKAQEMRSFFKFAEPNANDPISHPVDEASFDFACQVAVGLDQMVEEHRLDGLTYYYRGTEGKPFARIAAAMIPGLSILTSKGIPCSGEGDLKTCLAMKAMDLLGAGGSFTELYAMDFTDSIILMGHDGPFHLGIAGEQPVLRQLSTYHGKVGSGLSVEASVQEGPVTICGLSQSRNGKLKLLVAEGWCLPGDKLRIGNTNSRLRFTTSPEDPFDVAEWMNRWASEGPTHHVALGIGHRASVIQKLAGLLDIPFVKAL